MPYSDKQDYYIYRTVYDNAYQESLKEYRSEYYIRNKERMNANRKKNYQKVSTFKKEVQRLGNISCF
jgi:hypothetical protein